MTESEWLKATEPLKMLEFLREKGSDRKRQLFACACCRRAADVFDEHIQTAVELVERNVDEPTARSILAVAAMEPRLKDHRTSQHRMRDLPPWWDVVITTLSGQTEAVKLLLVRIGNLLQARANDTHAASQAAPGDELQAARAAWAVAERVRTQEQIMQCYLLRCLIGNPFRSVAVDPGWLTPSVVELARTIYEGKACDRIPELADALEKTCCSDPNLLGHLRGPEPHVRGCWAVDLILGRE
jgi:hypothetical protein